MLAAVVLAAPAVASAATFYVDDSATTPLNPCSSPTPANACQTISAAIVQARSTVGGDTIQVAAGNYNAETSGVHLNNAADAGDTIDGAGSGTDAGSSVIPLLASQDVEVLESNVTLRDVNIQAASNFQPVYIGNFTPTGPNGTTFENVHVLMNNTSTAWAVEADRSSNTTFNHLLVDGDSDWGGTTAYALRNSQSTNTVVNDSSLHANGPTILSRVSSLTVNRSVVLGPIALDQPVITVVDDIAAGSSTLTLDSSLVLLGNLGVKVAATTSSVSASATIRNSTIDPGVPKDTSVPGVAAQQTLAANTTSVGIDSSIVVGGLTSTGAGIGNMTCTNTDVLNTVILGILCNTAPGNPENNSTTTPALLFQTGGLIGNWHLLPTSPAIDTGAPGALAAGQSTTDLDGNPRLLDGNFDCVEGRDKGAYEVTGQSAPCPAPSTPGTSTPGSVTSPSVADRCAPLRAKLKQAKTKKKKRKLRKRLRALGC